MASLRLVAAGLLALGIVSCDSSPKPPGAGAEAQVTIVTDAMDAVLAILDRRRAGLPPSDSAWTELFGSTGYRRLAERERAMGREFSDSAFRSLSFRILSWPGWSRSALPPPYGTSSTSTSR